MDKAVFEGHGYGAVIADLLVVSVGLVTELAGTVPHKVPVSFVLEQYTELGIMYAYRITDRIDNGFYRVAFFFSTSESVLQVFISIGEHFRVGMGRFSAAQTLPQLQEVFCKFVMFFLGAAHEDF